MFTARSALWVNGREIAHAESDRAFDVRLTRGLIRAMRAELWADPRVHLRRSSSTDWLEVLVASSDDEGLLIDLVHRAAQAHRRTPGLGPTVPPLGEDRAVRRRLH
jgi:hypothetical protein